MSTKLDELKQEATELGLTFNPNISEAKLADKIETYYKSQETSAKELLTAIKQKESEEDLEEKSAVNGKNLIARKAREAEARARKTRVITIIDNDQRVNNQTTVATVSCSNMFFDLGTAHIPLNVPVEVRQGHIDVLKGVDIPQHGKDPKTGLSRVDIRPRYTISYEDIKTN